MGRVLGKKQITPFLYELIFGSEMGRVYKKKKKKNTQVISWKARRDLLFSLRYEIFLT